MAVTGNFVSDWLISKTIFSSVKRKITLAYTAKRKITLAIISLRN
jgi:hypothetical protein